MGNDQGSAGEPWLSAGFYDPEANLYRSENAFDFAHSNPFDPPKTLERYLNAGNKDALGAPYLVYKDNQIIDAEEFPEMRYYLENAHNYAHDYIGGTIGDPHTSFRDPFVFLLHSNVDRLFATWQLQPRKKWRLDPERIYGSESRTQARGIFPEVHIGILTPLEPWAGIDAPGAEEGIMEIRPWAASENEHLLKKNKKDSKDKSLVCNQPCYDTIVEKK